MVQTLPEGPSLMELLGSGIGMGLQTGLKQLAEERDFNKIFNNLPRTNNGMEEPSGSSQGISNLERIVTNPQAMDILFRKNPQRANMFLQMYRNQLSARKAMSQEELARTKIASTESKKYRERVEDIESSLPDKRMALSRIEDSLKSNDLKSFSNFMADYLESQGKPGEYLRTNSGAALQSATKEFLMGDIARIKGGRPNQFIEKQLSSAYPKAGYDKIANQKILKAMQTGVDIIEKEKEIYNRLSDEFEAQGKPVPGNVSKLVNKELKPYVLQKEKELQNVYQSLNNASKKISNSESFEINGKKYNIPKHLVPSFKKEMGIE